MKIAPSFAATGDSSTLFILAPSCTILALGCDLKIQVSNDPSAYGSVFRVISNDGKGSQLAYFLPRAGCGVDTAFVSIIDITGVGPSAVVLGIAVIFQDFQRTGPLSV